jgi:hypothetical protein
MVKPMIHNLQDGQYPQYSFFAGPRAQPATVALESPVQASIEERHLERSRLPNMDATLFTGARSSLRCHMEEKETFWHGS